MHGNAPGSKRKGDLRMNMLELENRIMQLRMDLNGYIAQSGNLTNLEKLKIQAMQQDIQMLQSELDILKNSQPQENQKAAEQPQAARQTTAPQPQVPQQPQMQAPRQPQPVPPQIQQTQAPGYNGQSPYTNGTSYVNRQPYVNGNPYMNWQSYANGAFYTNPRPQYTNKKAPDYEKVFGKAVMGIFASVLIFISMILFGTLVIPRLADVIKLAILYAASIGVSILGFFLMKKTEGINCTNRSPDAV